MCVFVRTSCSFYAQERRRAETDALFGIHISPFSFKMLTICWIIFDCFSFILHNLSTSSVSLFSSFLQTELVLDSSRRLTELASEFWPGGMAWAGLPTGPVATVSPLSFSLPMHFRTTFFPQCQDRWWRCACKRTLSLKQDVLEYT